MRDYTQSIQHNTGRRQVLINCSYLSEPAHTFCYYYQPQIEPGYKSWERPELWEREEWLSIQWWGREMRNEAQSSLTTDVEGGTRKSQGSSLCMFGLSQEMLVQFLNKDVWSPVSVRCEWALPFIIFFVGRAAMMRSRSHQIHSL